MIVYDRVPISNSDAIKIKDWLGSKEAQLFKECVIAQLNDHYFDAINKQSKSDGTEFDEAKFGSLAQDQLEMAKAVKGFLGLFETFADKEHGFFKLKINT